LQRWLEIETDFPEAAISGADASLAALCSEALGELFKPMGGGVPKGNQMKSRRTFQEVEGLVKQALRRHEAGENIADVRKELGLSGATFYGHKKRLQDESKAAGPKVIVHKKRGRRPSAVTLKKSAAIPSTQNCYVIFAPVSEVRSILGLS
jgi:hypothetical protein